jgi:ectoine hydroxylase-related dioxygenase (phytanoyl-CoA dioxygenase family)
MVQLFRAAGMAEIHASPRIHKAFAQLAGTADLVMSADRCGFNPPVRPGSPWRGAKLHFDLSRHSPPVSPRLQGIVYLTDTTEDQGAFRCVPGFHHQIDAWLQALPDGHNPNLEDLEALGPRSIAARGGDLIIWSAALPHGSQPNTAARPRIVHYLTMYPAPRADAD